MARPQLATKIVLNGQFLLFFPERCGKMWINHQFVWWWFQKIWKQMQVFTERNLISHSILVLERIEIMGTPIFHRSICASFKQWKHSTKLLHQLSKSLGLICRLGLCKQLKEWPSVFEQILVKSPWIALHHDVTSQATQNFHAKN